MLTILSFYYRKPFLFSLAAAGLFLLASAQTGTAAPENTIPEKLQTAVQSISAAQTAGDSSRGTALRSAGEQFMTSNPLSVPGTFQTVTRASLVTTMNIISVTQETDPETGAVTRTTTTRNGGGILLRKDIEVVRTDGSRDLTVIDYRLASVDLQDKVQSGQVRIRYAEWDAAAVQIYTGSGTALFSSGLMTSLSLTQTETATGDQVRISIYGQGWDAGGKIVSGRVAVITLKNGKPVTRTDAVFAAGLIESQNITDYENGVRVKTTGISYRNLQRDPSGKITSGVIEVSVRNYQLNTVSGTRLTFDGNVIHVEKIENRRVVSRYDIPNTLLFDNALALPDFPI